MFIFNLGIYLFYNKILLFNIVFKFISFNSSTYCFMVDRYGKKEESILNINEVMLKFIFAGFGQVRIFSLSFNAHSKYKCKYKYNTQPYNTTESKRLPASSNKCTVDDSNYCIQFNTIKSNEYSCCSKFTKIEQ